MKFPCKLLGMIGVVAALVNTATIAHATTPEEWKVHDQRVVKACAQASGLNDAKPMGEFAAFDDTVGQTAIVMSGKYPQKHMKGRIGTVLCLYDRRTSKANAIEWNLPAPAKSR